MTSRLRVRSGVYRGVPGWVLYGTDWHGRRVSIFFEHESAARRTQQRMVEGDYFTRPDDFTP